MADLGKTVDHFEEDVLKWVETPTVGMQTRRDPPISLKCKYDKYSGGTCQGIIDDEGCAKDPKLCTTYLNVSR